MPGEEHAEERHGEEQRRPDPRLAHHPAAAERHERQPRRRHPERPVDPEEDEAGERPAGGPGERRPHPEVELAQEEPAGERGDEQRERRLHPEEERQRQPEREEVERIIRRCLRRSGERVAAELVRVPERPLPGAPAREHRRPPGGDLGADVGVDPRGGLRHPERRPHALVRNGVEPEVGRRPDTAGEKRPTGEEERQQHEAEGDPAGNRRHPPCRRTDQEHGEQEVGSEREHGRSGGRLAAPAANRAHILRPPLPPSS
ncbi:MAG: hypothetical protein BWX64_02827 [Acidobacteria bacterium ADurb.Bin051]|nr:MAG: hypothetical protein BWX64_02827 [Acidobacteria bacterium ADurb.Bin051]